MYPAPYKLPSPVEEEELPEEEEEEEEDGREKRRQEEGDGEGNERPGPLRGSKKLKERKVRSSTDVREARDDVFQPGSDYLPSSPGTPPSSPPVARPPTSRRKKIWNSLRTRTRRLRGKSRDKDSIGDSLPDATNCATDEEGSVQTETVYRSSLKRRWRSEKVKRTSTVDIDSVTNEESIERVSGTATFGSGMTARDVTGMDADGGLVAGEGLDKDNDDGDIDSGITLVESYQSMADQTSTTESLLPTKTVSSEDVVICSDETSSQGSQQTSEGSSSKSTPVVAVIDHTAKEPSIIYEESSTVSHTESSVTVTSTDTAEQKPEPVDVEPPKPHGKKEPKLLKLAKILGKFQSARKRVNHESFAKDAQGLGRGEAAALRSAEETTTASSSVSAWKNLKKPALGKPRTSVRFQIPSTEDFSEYEESGITSDTSSERESDAELGALDLDKGGNKGLELDVSGAELEAGVSPPVVMEAGISAEEVPATEKEDGESQSRSIFRKVVLQVQATRRNAQRWKERRQAKDNKYWRQLIQHENFAKYCSDNWKQFVQQENWTRALRGARTFGEERFSKIRRWEMPERPKLRFTLLKSRCIRFRAWFLSFKCENLRERASSVYIFHSDETSITSPEVPLAEQSSTYLESTGDTHTEDISSLATGSLFSYGTSVDSQIEDFPEASTNSASSLFEPDTYPQDADEAEEDEESGDEDEQTYVDEEEESSLRQRQNVLMEHPFFLLDVRLQEGKDLVVRDSCGTSDPYVKFKVGGKQVYKSKIIFKNLNPKWEENFTIPIEDVNKPVNIKVFDYDRGLHDDPMGSTEIDVSQLELGKNNDLRLLLSDRGKQDYMGYLMLSCTLLPKTQEDKEQYFRQSVRATDVSGKKIKTQSWAGVVTIVLVEGIDLVPMDDNGLSDPYVKFKLGNEKYRSRHKSKTLKPKWLEQFDLRMYSDSPAQQMEITVFDHDTTGKDDFMGRATIDISNLESEMTHHLDVELEDGAGLLKLLLTISGTCSADAQSDLCNFTPDARQQDQLNRKYSLLRLSDMSDVGQLQVKVFKACNLKSADLGGQSDPFCVVELVNTRVQTHTEYKTLNPEWNKVFSLKVRDIHSVLEVTVFDEDKDKKAEFLGKVAIPLLKIRGGERRWYALKDKKLTSRTKGAIQLEMDLIFNHLKAAVRTVNPAEEKFMQVDPKFKIQLLKRNIDRVGQLVSVIMETHKFVQSCFSWESPSHSATAFIVFLVMVWNFELYMLPISLLLIFMKNLLIAHVLGSFRRDAVQYEYFDEDDEDEDEEKEKEEKKSLKEKFQSIQDICLKVQQGTDKVASLGERIKNTFNWTVPWLSWLAVVVLSIGVVVLYFIPLRWLVLAWGSKKFIKKGINKFTKNLRKPHAMSNNELLDFLSRVPSDREVAQYREFRPEISPGHGKKNKRS